MPESTLIQQQRSLLLRAKTLEQKFEKRLDAINEHFDRETRKIELAYSRALIQLKNQPVDPSSEEMLWRWGTIGAGLVTFGVSLYLIILLLVATHGNFWLLIIPFILPVVTYQVIARRRNAYLTFRRDSQLAEAQASYQRDMAFYTQEKQASLDALEKEFGEFNRLFTSGQERDYSGNYWSSDRWKQWAPCKTSVRTTRIGAITPPLQPPLPNLPVFVTPLGGKNIIFKTPAEGTREAKSAIKALLCRLLATQPPGKVIFTFIDAEALGRNAGDFMDLWHHNPALVTEQIWVEPQEIEQQLRDLTKHIEFINRIYLREGGYTSMDEYNTAAGEVVEPYHMLVVWDFPVKFSQEAAERLVSISTHGPRCGVSTIVLYDIDTPLPDGFDILSDWETGILSDERFTRHLTGRFRTGAMTREWNGEQVVSAEQLKPISKLAKWESVADVFVWGDADGSFSWNDPDYIDAPLHFDDPPRPALFEHILKEIGEGSRSSTGVKVSFEYAAPPVEKWWTGDASQGIDVTVGRPMTGRIDKVKPQSLELGYEATLQHAFVGGMTGSGKSVLLRVIIAGLALKYSPDEVKLYLLDFKRVSFVPFVNDLPPQARVVAIESDREFALSVLREMFAEFEARKKSYADLGRERNKLVETVSQYRSLSGRKLPRIVLIADELQVLVSVDDDVKTEALQLLTRIVKEGRSFGIHLILATQTLAGTAMHEVVREFVSQFGIRIALKSSDDDARLILDENNPAAKELIGKGHAIYNAKGGIKSANVEFQSAMFTDGDERYLRDIQQLARRRGWVPAQRQVVFEGYKIASLAENDALQALLARPRWQPPAKQVPVWLGEPMDITTQTVVYFKQESRCNLLVLGLHQDYARGLFMAALITLAAQYPPGSICFYILDLSSDGAFRNVLARDVGRIAAHTMHVVKRSDVAGVVTAIRDEIESREHEIDKQDEGRPDAPARPALYLFIYGLPRERDMSYPISEESNETLGEVLYAILRDGPQHRVHTLLWCDRRANLESRFDRWALDVFDKKVLLQQVPVDDVREIVGERVESPEPDRALFHSDDETRREKFRPYPVPPGDWLQNAIEAIRRKL